ncbi:MAG: FAD/NAD(P)-binding protein, partial [Rhodospirillaceae bacterium]|nr:FAD/NAD(P)-binding protein [Rhodospirillaceae bacterium]
MDHCAVAIVGGGFSGAVFALHLLREVRRSLCVSVVEPRSSLGRGLAYGTDDPDHRLNGPIEVHMVYPEQPGHLRNWFLESGGMERDPKAASADGNIFIRRSVFGEYVGAQLEAAAM